MNRNVKDYLILKTDFHFAIPWITLTGGSTPNFIESKIFAYKVVGYALVVKKSPPGGLISQRGPGGATGTS